MRLNRIEARKVNNESKDKLNWNPDKIPISHYMWEQSILPVLNNTAIKKKDHIMIYFLGDMFDASHLLESRVDEGHLHTINFAKVGAISLSDKPIPTYENQFDIIFAFFNPHLIKLELAPRFFQRVYLALKPGGRFIFVLPTDKTSTIATFKQVIASGRFDSLSEERHLSNTDFITQIKNLIEDNHFSNCELDTYQGQIPLPNLFTFTQYLNLVAFSYKNITPSAISNDIIEMQTQFFDEYCQKHYGGQYLFDYTLDVLKAQK